MRAQKTVEPGHVVTNGAPGGAETDTALDDLQKPENLYATDMAPLANPAVSESVPGELQATPNKPEPQAPDVNAPEVSDSATADSGGLALVVLKNGATFNYMGQVFRRDEPTGAEPEIAERLLRSGYFERG